MQSLFRHAMLSHAAHVTADEIFIGIVVNAAGLTDATNIRSGPFWGEQPPPGFINQHCPASASTSTCTAVHVMAESLSQR